MINKIATSVADAIGEVADGSVILVSGFGTAGIPDALIDGLLELGGRDFTIVCNNAGNGYVGLAKLLQQGRVRKIICSFPRQPDSWVFDELYRTGRIELELVPQGNIAERCRAAGAGIGAFYTATGVGTPLAKGKEVRTIDGRDYLLEYPIHGDLALVKAEKGDRWGNLTYRLAARNFGPVMATAAKRTIASVHDIVELGALDPECVVTPGVFVTRLVKIPFLPTRSGGIKEEK